MSFEDEMRAALDTFVIESRELLQDMEERTVAGSSETSGTRWLAGTSQRRWDSANEEDSVRQFDT